jgi:hypothetical protein
MLNINKDSMHHAYCILGEANFIVNELQNFLKKELKFSVHDNPDFWYGKYDILDIEDSRKLKEIHQNKPITYDKKIFIVSTNFITEKAQNAMLKLFEEPSGKTHFFLIMPSAQNIIPTLRSRMIILEHEEKNGLLINGKNFLKASIKERMEMIKVLMDSISHERSRGLIASDEEKSKIEVVKLINSIEVELFLRCSALSLRQSASLLENIEKVRQYASDGSPSLKMLLEYLALVTPAD